MNDITIRRPIQWLCAAATDIGAVRAMNEDAILARPDVGLWAVADGMGGHDAGNVASTMVIDALDDLPKPKRLSEFVDAVEDRVLASNRRLLEYSEIMLDGRTVGSTFICLLIYGEIGVCLWTGDSRLYRYRAQELTQLSHDHSEVAELMRAGVITAEQAADHPAANVITRAVGTAVDLCIDIEIFSVQVGDSFLLCSDGLYNSVDRETMVQALQADHPRDIVADLIDCALQNDAADNVSAVVVKGVRRTGRESVEAVS